jgi:hypothetical protein
MTGKCYDWINDPPQVVEWVKCSERLPENESKVLVLTKDRRIYIFKYEPDREPLFPFTVPGGYFAIDYVTDWMPLPNIRKEEKYKQESIKGEIR